MWIGVRYNERALLKAKRKSSDLFSRSPTYLFEQRVLCEVSDGSPVVVPRHISVDILSERHELLSPVIREVVRADFNRHGAEACQGLEV